MKPAELYVCGVAIRDFIDQELKNINPYLNKIKDVKISDFADNYYFIVRVVWDIELENCVTKDLLNTHDGLNFVSHIFVEKIRKILSIAKR